MHSLNWQDCETVSGGYIGIALEILELDLSAKLTICFIAGVYYWLALPPIIAPPGVP